jgi:hypothetical protein
MLFNVLHTTLAFAPEPEDLEDIDFTAPIIAQSSLPLDDSEGDQGEP